MFEQAAIKVLPNADDSARNALHADAMKRGQTTPESHANDASKANAPAESANDKRIADETKFFKDLYTKENFQLDPIKMRNGPYQTLEEMEKEGKISFTPQQLVTESQRIANRDFTEFGRNYYKTGEQTKFWTDAEIDKKVQDMVAKVPGIDISNHQAHIDWKQVKDAGYKFAFMKATEGTGYVDAYFNENRAGARDNGLKVGYYHYFHPEESVDEQVKNFCKVVGHAEPDSLRLFIDAEDASLYAPYTVQQRVQKIDDFCQGVKKELGVTPQIAIYCSPNFADEILGNSDVLKKYSLFIANYGVSEPTVPGPWSKWDFWQYTSKGHVPGINGYVDLDVFNGTDLSQDNMKAKNHS